ncbi:MAG: calcium-binding protein [Oceanospirillaceae bacterium]|nr:calcium-binding protein [Oceanospirillaceae bacterium]
MKYLFSIGCVLIGLITPFGSAVAAESAYCAKVKIEILQELTLERQGFEATMRIGNGLDTFALEDVSVDILFEDENQESVVATSDPNATSADFFIRLDDQQNIAGLAQLEKGSISGGRIEPATEAQIKWLIIPVPGAAKNSPEGKLYFVGAKLRYTYGGSNEEVVVDPDSIIVKPQPKLTLDYFLTEHVFGDDAFTEIIEPIEPYTLGIRIANNGYGAARNVKLDSAQPQIVENEQGLSIGFNIAGSYVNDAPAEPSLLLNFGDIPAGGRTTGRWIMETTLSGKFIDFSASVSHGAEYGGELTSIIDGANTHFLIRNVQVDMQGRDPYQDFLARDGGSDQLTVYESENIGANQAQCDDCSPVFRMDAALSAATNTVSGVRHTLTPASQEPGFIFIKIPDPYEGDKVLSRVVRSDGKTLLDANAWLGKERNEDKVNFDHFIYLFDQQNTSSYTLDFADSSEIPQAPIIEFVPNKTTYEGGQVGFLVRASDANGDDVNVTIKALPLGAEFSYEMGQPSGKGIFNWFPQLGQAGNYPVTFVANDGNLTTQFTMTIKVNPEDDIDGDGLSDAWEREYFGDLSRDGTGDFDQDGYSDLEEYEKGWNPIEAAKVPNVPTIVSPIFDGETDTLTPELVFLNSAHSADIAVTYTLEVFSDLAMTQQVALFENITEDIEQTAITLSQDLAGQPLNDNSNYFWRVRGVSSEGSSEWAIGQFFINTINEAPAAPVAQSPMQDDIVSAYQPVLSVNNVTDIDLDTVQYSFYVFAANTDLSGDVTTMTPLHSITDLIPGENGITQWQVPEALQEDTQYQWIVIATDEHGLATQSQPMRFLVSTQNDAPSAPVISAPAHNSEVSTFDLDLLWINGEDPEGASLEYEVQWDSQSDFNSGEQQIIENIAQQQDISSQNITLGATRDNQRVYWRVRATDGDLYSQWVNGQFFVNTMNDAPSEPTLANPAMGATVEILSPAIVVNAANDVDGDVIQYHFELYSDAGLTDLVASSLQLDTTWNVPQALLDNRRYYWRVQAQDEHGEMSSWSNRYDFFVNNGGINDEPLFNFVLPSENIELTDGDVLIQWTDSDPDSNANITLWYEGNNGEIDTIAVDIKEDADGTADQYTWHISDLPVGEYQIKAMILDEDNRHDATALGKVNIIPFEGHVLPTLMTQNRIDESGQTQVQVDVVLDRAPRAGTQVSINIAMSDTSEAEIVSVTQEGETKSTNYLYFTEQNWNKPYSVFVKGKDDCEVDPDTPVDLVLNNVSSDDVGFDGIDPQDISLVNRDNESPNQKLFICEYDQISQEVRGEKIVTTFKAKLKNVGERVQGVQASLTVPSDLYEIVDGSKLNFESVKSNQITLSTDTFTLSYNRTKAFSASDLIWDIKVIQNSENELPIGWSSKDIGWIWKKGQTNVSSGGFLIQASGLDIWNIGDSFHFASRNLNGDGEIVARINSLNKTHKWTKAGVMIRESDWTGSKNVFLAMTPENGIQLQHRSTANWVTRASNLHDYRIGTWLKLDRRGDLISAYISRDGFSWIKIGEVEISLNASVQIGLAVSSHKWFKYTQAGFSSLWVEER